MIAVHAVLWGWCLSVDEHIQGSTPALAIHGSVITPTPKYTLIIGAFSKSYKNHSEQKLFFVF